MYKNKARIKVYTCLDGGLSHSFNNLNTVIEHLATFNKYKFRLYIIEFGAFATEFKNFFDCYPPKNIKIRYAPGNDNLDTLIRNKKNRKRVVKINNKNDLTLNHYIYRAKTTNKFFFKVKKPVINQIRKKTKHINFKNLLAVHYRNTDHKSNIKKIFSQIDSLKFNSIFLATDHFESVDIFKKKYVKKTFIQLAKLEPIGDKKNFHFFSGSVDQSTKLFECLVDLYVCSMASQNIYSSGSWARLIPKIKKQRILFY